MENKHAQYICQIMMHFSHKGSNNTYFILCVSKYLESLDSVLLFLNVQAGAFMK